MQPVQDKAVDDLTAQLENMHLILAGSPMDLPGVDIDSQTHSKRTLSQLNRQFETIKEQYQQDRNLVRLSERIQLLTSQFLMSFGQDFRVNGHHGPVMRQIPQESEAYPYFTAIQDCFTRAVVEHSQTAKEAYDRNDYTHAFNEYVVLEQSLSYEAATARYFQAQIGILATLFRQKKIHEAVHLLLALEELKVPQQLEKACAELRTVITDEVLSQFSQNEAAFNVLRENIDGAGRRVGTILSKERLQNDKNLSAYVRDLQPIRRELRQYNSTLQLCNLTLKDLSKLAKLLGHTPQSCSGEVSSLYTYWNELCSSALDLFESLLSAETSERKNIALQDWIRARIHEYNCDAGRLSALHQWAFSYLGTLFFCNEVSQRSLDDTVGLALEYSELFFRHLQCFPRDVRFSMSQFDHERRPTGKIHLDMSLLLVAVISTKLKTEYCNVAKIRETHTATWTDWWNAIKRLPLVSSVLTAAPRALPAVEITDEMMQRVPHQQMPHITLKVLVEAFERNDRTGFNKLTPEQVVEFFEHAYKLLKMPQKIAEDWIEPLDDTPEFQDALNALQWLRLVQAKKGELPYDALEAKLKVLSGGDFLRWIAMYKPSRIKINPRFHHKLFLTLAATVEALFKNKQAFTDGQVEQIFKFVADRYMELSALEYTFEQRTKLDSMMIQVLARSVHGLANVQAYHKAEVLRKLSCLNTQYIADIAQLLADQKVRKCLEEAVYPQIRWLDMKWGLHEHSEWTDFRRCVNVETLIMPLSDGQECRSAVQWLAKNFKSLQHLNFRNGPLVVEDVNIPLASLYLHNITTPLNLANCSILQANVRDLSLHGVQVEGALSWVSTNRTLQRLSVTCAPGTQIGSLVNGVVVLGHPTLREIELGMSRLQDHTIQPAFIEDDRELYSSLLTLIDQHHAAQPITKVTLFADSRGALLEYLLKAKKAASIKMLTIPLGRKQPTQQQISVFVQTYNHQNQQPLNIDDPQTYNWVVWECQKQILHAELNLLGRFTQLESFTFHTDDDQLAAEVRAHIFEGCHNLQECIRMNNQERTEIKIRKSAEEQYIGF